MKKKNWNAVKLNCNIGNEIIYSTEILKSNQAVYGFTQKMKPLIYSFILERFRTIIIRNIIVNKNDLKSFKYKGKYNVTLKLVD